jgi:hypothetical protein
MQFSPKRGSLTQRVLGRGALVLVLAFGLHGADLSVPVADLRAHVELLASDLLKGRATRSHGLDVAAEYIAAQFRRAGLEPLADGSYFQIAGPGTKNVIGVMRGSDPELRVTYVLVTAHYDHVGSKAEGEGDIIWNGANDNASGVATLIEIADALAKTKPGRTLIFIAYYGEEKGMVGSRHYAENPAFPIEATVAQVNIEQTGRTDDLDGPNVGAFNVTGFDYSEVAGILEEAAKPLGVQVVKRSRWSEMAFERSDNEALAKKGVPAHTISVAYMYPDYHKESDHWDKLDYANMAKVTEAAAAGVLALANRPSPPRWYDDIPKAAALGDRLGRVTTRPGGPPAASAPESGSSPASPKRLRSKPSQRRSPTAPANQSGTAPPQKSGAAQAR